ncbi:MAG TPA: hypothetical protein VF719_07930, partial [Abditibacteriaceae bacterium]
MKFPFSTRCALALSSFIIGSYSPAAFAQTAAGTLVIPPVAERFEGTVGSMPGDNPGAPEITAEVRYQAPDSLRIDITPNAVALTTGQTILASGTETRIFDAATRRVQRFPYNIAREPWRSQSLEFGGPANVALFGLARAALENSYALQRTPALVTLDAKPESAVRIRDFARSGGGGKQGLFYAAFKRYVYETPFRLTLDLQGNSLVSRTEFDQKTAVLSRSEITLDAGKKWPVSAVTRDAKNNVLARFRYALKARETPFEDTTFALPEMAKNEIVEDAVLSPIATYSGKENGGAKFNLGIAHLRQSEDIEAGFQALTAAAQLAPNATAPAIAIFDASIATRQIHRAGPALERLAQLLTPESLVVATRRATLAGVQRDWPAAIAALEIAERAAPQNLSLKLWRAGILRSRGEITAARTLLGEILASELYQPLTQIAAAEALAATVSPLNQTEATELLATVPDKTQWQQLARTHLQLWTGSEAKYTGISEPAALASVAIALERELRDDAAVALWQGIATRTTGDASALAQSHLLALAARRGDAPSALKAYREILAHLPDEASRRREQDLLLDTWRKSFRQSDLRVLLDSRAITASATEDDMWALLAFQETHGTPEEIGSTIRAAAARFSGRALWHSRLAELLLAEREAVSRTQEPARARLYNEALAAIAKARELEPAQPYYPMQAALIRVQRATETTMIVDADVRVNNRRLANEALDELERNYPNDSDVAVAVALGRNALAPRPTL